VDGGGGVAVSAGLVLAVDGGNSKTDLALASADGALLALARGPLSSPHHIGLDGCLELLEGLLARALDVAGLDGARPAAEVAHVLVAGADLPAEEAALQAAAEARGWAARTVVQNDTFAILRAGTDRGWGVAIVCGAGINAIGVAPDGRHVRFPALGPITGDWGGGYDVGMAAVTAAARSADGRGPSSLLEQTVPAYFGLATPAELGEALHTGAIPHRDVLALAPTVFAAAEHDAVAAAILDRLAEEVVAFARATLVRLRLTGEAVEVLLGGGLMRGAGPGLLGAIEAGLRELGPAISARVVADPPVVGAALLGLDDLGAGAAAHERLRRELRDAVADTIPATIGSTSDG
jgi:N-acetylglucosamine kinase-like BadF-type ATPase